MPSKRNATFSSLRRFWRRLPQDPCFCFTSMTYYATCDFDRNHGFSHPKRSQGCQNVSYHLKWKTKQQENSRTWYTHTPQAASRVGWACMCHGGHPMKGMPGRVTRWAFRLSLGVAPYPETSSLAFHAGFPSLSKLYFWTMFELSK